jgi:hypothetical protein
MIQVGLPLWKSPMPLPIVPSRALQRSNQTVGLMF